MKDVKNPPSIVPVRSSPLVQVRLASIVQVRLATAEVVNLPAPVRPRLRTGELDEKRAIDLAAWTSMVASAYLPTGALDEKRAIDLLVTVAIPQALPRMESEFSRETLKIIVQKKLREGQLPFVTLTIRFADEGDKICDEALQLVCAEMMSEGGRLREQEAGWMPIWTYGQRRLVPHTHKYRPGRPRHGNLIRDVQICVLIVFACRWFRVPATRNRASRRPNSAPSAISLVVAALARCDSHHDESSVQENFWFGLPGELVREDLSERGLWPVDSVDSFPKK